MLISSIIIFRFLLSSTLSLSVLSFPWRAPPRTIFRSSRSKRFAKSIKILYVSSPHSLLVSTTCVTVCIPSVAPRPGKNPHCVANQPSRRITSRFRTPPTLSLQKIMTTMQIPSSPILKSTRPGRKYPETVSLTLISQGSHGNGCGGWHIPSGSWGFILLGIQPQRYRKTGNVLKGAVWNRHLQHDKQYSDESSAEYNERLPFEQDDFMLGVFEGVCLELTSS